MRFKIQRIKTIILIAIIFVTAFCAGLYVGVLLARHTGSSQLIGKNKSLADSTFFAPRQLENPDSQWIKLRKHGVDSIISQSKELTDTPRDFGSPKAALLKAAEEAYSPKKLPADIHQLIEQ